MEEEHPMENFAEDAREFERLVNQMIDASEGISQLFTDRVIGDEKHILMSIAQFVAPLNFHALGQHAQLLNYSRVVTSLLDDKEAMEKWMDWSDKDKAEYFIRQSQLSREKSQK